jgi:hypothetical protein
VTLTTPAETVPHVDRMDTLPLDPVEVRESPEPPAGPERGPGPWNLFPELETA